MIFSFLGDRITLCLGPFWGLDIGGGGGGDNDEDDPPDLAGYILPPGCQIVHRNSRHQSKAGH